VGEGQRLLDVGAGAGYVTEQARPLFHEVVCTETSRPLARRLEARGFRVHARDLLEAPLADEAPFDVIACLNVLDRTRRPLSLLRQLGAMLTSETRLLVSMPLPVRAHAYVSSACISPDEPLPSTESRFEAAVIELTRDLFEAHGFGVERIARAPYLSHGDAHAPVYALDDALWVLRRARS
jgi:SAM-dependent methyltransferase